MATKFLDNTGLTYLWSKIKAHFATHGETGSAIVAADKTSSIPFGEVDSTSTSTAYTATVAGITELVDGTCVLLKNGVVTSAANFTININGLGAKPSYNNMATGNSVTPTAPTRDTTIFNINYTMLFVYSSTLVDGGAWICYRGYDANTNTIGYQLRTNSYILNASDGFRYYVILFTSADGTKWVPANSNKSNSATTAKTVVQTPINPFGEIVYCGNSTNYSAGSAVTATAIWQQYTVTLGYSFNRTGAALTLTTKKPVYVKCAPQADGSAIIDSTTPYVQTLPTTDDGKIYILLGMAYSATAIELLMNHPVYYHKDGAIRVWTNAAETDISGKANIADLSDVAFSGDYDDLTDKPTIPQNLHVTLTKSGNIYTASHTFAEIEAALNTGGVVDLFYDDYLYQYDGLVDGNATSQDQIYFYRISMKNVGGTLSQSDNVYEHSIYLTRGSGVWAEDESKLIGTASTTKTGVVKLDDSVTSTSTSLAATANAVKQAYDHGGVQSVNGQTGAVVLSADATKADKVSNATTGDIATLDSTGNLTDSGVGISDIEKKTLIISLQNESTVVSGIYSTIKTALSEGRDVVLLLTTMTDNYRYFRLGSDTDDIGGILYFYCNEGGLYSAITVMLDDSVNITERTSIAQNYGNITTIGTLNGTGVTIGNGDSLAIADYSNSSKIVKSSITFDSSTTTQALSKKGTWETFYKKPSTGIPLSDLNSGAVDSAPTSGSDNLVTSGGVYSAIQGLPTPMQFKGSLGTGGTYTSSTIPAATTSNKGWTLKVITDGTYQSVAAKVGDTLISDGSAWILIPSGDEPSGTVTSVTLNATSPIAIDSSAAITTSGTRTISHADSGVTAGTYKSVTVDAKGHVTGGTNPTTLSGYGITDAIDTSSTAQTKSGNLTAAKFITSGGTSGQFVKGDGSIDTHEYMKLKKLTTSGYVSSSSKYLKLVMPSPTTSWMMTLGVVIYSGYVSDIYYIGGYNYQSSTQTWYSPSVIYLSSGAYTKTIYFGKNDYDGGDNKLWVAIPMSSYSHVSLMENSVNYPASFDIANITYSLLDANPENWDATTNGTIAFTKTVNGTGGLPANSELVHLAGAETISGVKTFTNGLKLNTGSSWTNSDRTIPFGANAAPTTIQYVSNDANTGLTYNPSTGTLKAGSFVKRGGTSSQFLKADGSVDSNTYLTSSSLSTYAPLASPALTGTPTAPTATTGTNTTQIATTAFVQSALGDYDKEPLVIEVNATDTTVPSGTFASIGTALTAGRKVFVKVTDDGDFYLSLLWDISASEFEYRFGSNYAENACYCIIYSNNNIEIGYETFALQNHIHGNIQNGGTLQSNDIDIANGDKLIVTDSSNSARIARTSLSFDGSTTTQALSKKGTWETFLKTAPVTSVNGQTGAVNLTIPTNVSAFTNDAGYATDMNLSTISSSTTSTTLSNTNTYYRHLSTGISTLNVTLPNVSSATKVQHIMLYIKTGTSPTLNVTSSGGATITYVDGFEIEASKEYEISFLWNGAKWIVAYNILAVS